MHQPCYVDPASGKAMLPWVRLHATKGYLDMIALAEKFSKLRLTFNLTPVLVKQLEELGNGQVRDEWGELAATPAESLDRESKLKMLEHFFSAPLDTMIMSYPRYSELWWRRGPTFQAAQADEAIAGWDAQDWRDLQVWQNLAWFGFTADETYPEISELKKKGEKYSEDDKRIVLQRQIEVVKSVLQRYRKLAEEKRIELTTTPFYHPILPLLIDTENARRAMPWSTLPPRFAFAEDAKQQLARAVSQHERVFGRKPRGIWPAEGSVCPEMLPILEEQGIEWFGTDQEILYRSTPDRWPNTLYQPYECLDGEGRAVGVFRDRDLSDFIGFVASRNPPDVAAQGFMNKLEQIRQRAAADKNDLLVNVILDGENAWNHFQDGGKSFLEQLYGALSENKTIVTTTVSEYLEFNPPQRQLARLHTGSWINADFDIWIGEGEENRAWELLGQARRFWQTKVSRGEATNQQAALAQESLFAAEGSDWFWWYGPDFSVEEDLILDRLFRSHLQNVYRALGSNPPGVLDSPICRADVAHVTQSPTGYIEPTIDGLATSFYEWQGAGKFVVSTGEGQATMARNDHRIRAIYFGFSPEHLFLRVDPAQGPIDLLKLAVRFHFFQPRNVVLQLSRPDENSDPLIQLVSSHDGIHFEPEGVHQGAVNGEIIELALPFNLLGFRQDSEAAFVLQLYDNQLELERYPAHGQIKFVLPGPEFASKVWQV